MGAPTLPPPVYVPFETSQVTPGPIISTQTPVESGSQPGQMLDITGLRATTHFPPKPMMTNA